MYSKCKKCGKIFRLIYTIKEYCSRKCYEDSNNHGMAGTRLYNIWRGMKTRCYANREISICEEWSSDFVNFMNWAIKNGYKDNFEIDRINNDLGYNSNNCRWATKSQQACNRRGTRVGSVNHPYKGVYGDGKRPKKWKSSICINGISYYLGRFNTAEEAALAYNKAAIEFHGEYACLNKIEEKHEEVCSITDDMFA